MKFIEKIEIQYFRSIYRSVINDINDISIFTGKNDVGKSNVLKALNLFFNNETEAECAFEFNENFNFKRLTEVRKESIKGKQFIQLKITFIRGNQFEKTLPKKFTITKKWLRDSINPIVTDDLSRRLSAEGKNYNERSTASLTRFLNKIDYYYIPAIKDSGIFTKMLVSLRNTIYNEKLTEDVSLKSSMKDLFSKVAASAEELSDEFKKATNIDSMFATPDSIEELYNTMVIVTKTGDNTVGLDKRGDGIRVRYIPSILNYIASNTNNMCIWGFEEPENSLEFNLAHQMALDFINIYSKNSMILLTSHSPAFINLESFINVSIIRCFRKETITDIKDKNSIINEVSIEEELGYAKILQKQYAIYLQKIQELHDIKEIVNNLQNELELVHKPTLLTEGKTDVLILSEAWKQLYKKECPFLIKSCNVYSEDDTISAAGCLALNYALRSHRHDSGFVVIGLFDRDEKGILSYKLDENFKEDNNKRYKKHKNGVAYAMMLPTPTGKEQFSEFSNLCIEYYFDKQYLDKEIDGIKLKLIPKPIIEHCGSKEISRSYADAHEIYLHEIDKHTKNFFASKIVPTLPIEAFEPFRCLFDVIDEIMNDITIVGSEVAIAKEDNLGESISNI